MKRIFRAGKSSELGNAKFIIHLLENTDVINRSWMIDFLEGEMTGRCGVLMIAALPAARTENDFKLII